MAAAAAVTLGRGGEATTVLATQESKRQAFLRILFLIGYHERQLPERPGKGGNVSNPELLCESQ